MSTFDEFYASVELHVTSTLLLFKFRPSRINTHRIVDDLIERHGVNPVKIAAACQYDYLCRKVGEQWAADRAQIELDLHPDDMHAAQHVDSCDCMACIPVADSAEDDRAAVDRAEAMRRHPAGKGRPVPGPRR